MNKTYSKISLYGDRFVELAEHIGLRVYWVAVLAWNLLEASLVTVNLVLAQVHVLFLKQTDDEMKVDYACSSDNITSDACLECGTESVHPQSLEVETLSEMT